MRLSEILGCEVVDERGEPAGKVRDVRLVQDGPPIGQFGARLRVSGLVVGGWGLGDRFGYHRSAMKGPWLVKALVGVAQRGGGFVDWSRVLSVDPARARITISGSVEDLPHPGPAQ
jgi:hypothetical protein